MPGRVAGVAAAPGRAAGAADLLADELELDDAAGLAEDVFVPAKAVLAMSISKAAVMAAEAVLIPVRMILLLRMTDSSNVFVAAKLPGVSMPGLTGRRLESQTLRPQGPSLRCRPACICEISTAKCSSLSKKTRQKRIGKKEVTIVARFQSSACKN